MLLSSLDDAADEELISEIADRSEGNRLFAEELLSASKSGRPNEFPETLKGLLLARVEGLENDYRQILRLAAVAGRSVSSRLLAAVANLPEPVIIKALVAAVDHHVLKPDAATDTFTFRHALVREAVYDSVLSIERRRLHAEIAAALNDHPDLGGPTPAAAAAELAYHYYEAHDIERALSSAIEAGTCGGRCLRVHRSGTAFHACAGYVGSRLGGVARRCHGPSGRPGANGRGSQPGR